MDTTNADYTDLPVGLMLEPDQGRALVGLDVHGEFIPFAELKLAAVVEMLASASDRQAQQVQSQPTAEPQPAAEPQAEPPAAVAQVPQGEPSPQVPQEDHGAGPEQPATPQPQQP